MRTTTPDTLTRPELIDVAGRFPELTFILVTDGSLLDDAVLVKLERYGNIIPVLGLDLVEAVTDEWRGHGAYGRVAATMAEMKARRLFFGVSITVTRANFPLTTSRVFVHALERARAVGEPLGD